MTSLSPSIRQTRSGNPLFERPFHASSTHQTLTDRQKRSGGIPAKEISYYLSARKHAAKFLLKNHSVLENLDLIVCRYLPNLLIRAEERGDGLPLVQKEAEGLARCISQIRQELRSEVARLEERGLSSTDARMDVQAGLHHVLGNALLIPAQYAELLPLMPREQWGPMLELLKKSQVELTGIQGHLGEIKMMQRLSVVRLFLLSEIEYGMRSERA